MARPDYRVERRDEGVSLHLALPGVAKEDVQLAVEQDLLKVTAERQDTTPDDWKVLQELPRPDRYELQVRLHRDLDPASVSATLNDGILTLAIERHEAAKPRTIAIN